MKIKEESKSSILVNYGIREKQILKELENLSKNNLIPDNKNEILRRGLHSVRFLAESNENLFLSLLSQVLYLGSTRYDTKLLRLAKELAFTIHAIQIAKYGVLQAEIFDAIPRELQLLDQLIAKNKPDPSTIEEDFKHSMKKLAISVDTVFRKKPKSDKAQSSVKLFPIIFLSTGRSRIKIPKMFGGVKIVEELDYEKISSEPKRNFLRNAILFANSFNDEGISKFSEELKKKMR